MVLVDFSNYLPIPANFFDADREWRNDFYRMKWIAVPRLLEVCVPRLEVDATRA